MKTNFIKYPISFLATCLFLLLASVPAYSQGKDPLGSYREDEINKLLSIIGKPEKQSSKNKIKAKIPAAKKTEKIAAEEAYFQKDEPSKDEANSASVKQLRDERDENLKAIKGLQRELKRTQGLASENDTLKAQLNEKTKENMFLSNELDKIKTRVDGMSSAVADKMRENAGKIQEDMDAKIGLINDEKNNIQSQLEKATSALSAAENKASGLESELETAKLKLKEERDSRKEKEQSFLSQIDDLKKQFEDTQEKVSVMTKELEGSCSAEEKATFLLTIKQLHNEQDENLKTIKGLQTKLKENEGFSSQVGLLKTKLKDTFAKNTSLSEEVASLNSKIEAIKSSASAKEKDAVEKIKGESASALASLKEEKSTLKAKLSRSSQKIKDLENKNKQLASALSDAKDGLAKEVDANKANVDSSSEEISNLKKQLLGSQSKAESVSKELDKANEDNQKEKNSLLSKLKDSDDKIKALNDQLVEEQLVSKGLEDKLAAVKSEFEKEKASLADKVGTGDEEKLKEELLSSQKRTKELEDWILSKKSICAEVEDGGTAVEKDRFAGRETVEEAVKDTSEIKDLINKKADISEVINSKDKEKLDEHYNLGVFYGKSGMYFNEEKEYLECLKINPNDADVHYNLAILYDDYLNNNKKAIEQYKEYLKLRPAGEDFQQVKKWILEAEEELRIGAEVR